MLDQRPGGLFNPTQTKSLLDLDKRPSVHLERASGLLSAIAVSPYKHTTLSGCCEGISELYP